MVVIVFIFIIIGKIINYIFIIVLKFEIKNFLNFGDLILILVVKLKLYFNVVLFFGSCLLWVFLFIFLVYLLGIFLSG